MTDLPFASAVGVGTIRVELRNASSNDPYSFVSSCTTIGCHRRSSALGGDERHQLFELWTANPDVLVGIPVDDAGDGTLLHQPPLADDDELIGHQRHLRQQMAGHEHSPVLLGEVSEKVADPADALGIEAVSRLVENHRVRVAEQGGGDT